MIKIGTLLLLRHGSSVWNQRNLFTGWVDIPLSKEGVDEALAAGKLIAGYDFDALFTSQLLRAQMTLFLAMSVNHSDKIPLLLHPDDEPHSDWRVIHSPEIEKASIPVYAAWQLNERHYGRLQGKNKGDLRKEYGDAQVESWRRSYDIAPPDGESLAMTSHRAIPYFQEMILPHLKLGKTLLISAHGNSLRAIIMHIEALTEEEVVQLEIPTALPLLYHWDQGRFCRGSIDAEN